MVPHMRRTGTLCLSRGGRIPSPSEWRVPLFQRDGGPVSDVWLPLAARTVTPSSDGRGPLFRGTGSPFIVECRSGNPFLRPTMTHRWRIPARPLVEGEVKRMDWIRGLQFVKPLVYCFRTLGYREFAGLGAAVLAMRHRLDYLSWKRLSVRAIAYQFEKLIWLRTAKDDRAL